ncbi:related to Probable lipase C1672.09 [Saccharomycodes ludwigii]|uniref:Related to Probable lipase C1672.09 n=1 Tax=Saccharomycodes ludwigii TaxID=36035 RepID=A0A376B3R1_9ASCO|nr:hypothetical protein SCDLUD_001071 [Saccharomycodes ludwigii]KAH3903432.1 hypothetical protein SCDLUD_001071 [Saccharomycodes ludwigii]SSD59335.1 related to Probable lipase C1672.09 [Saccharomycodes ludwigii]
MLERLYYGILFVTFSIIRKPIIFLINILKLFLDEITLEGYKNSKLGSRYKYSDPLIEKIAKAKDITDLCYLHGYYVHEHVVKTKDGYLLTIHRITKTTNVNNIDGDSRKTKPVVYFHHGLLTNSELFVSGDTKEKCLPLLLVDLGYDVWLGNNRGNSYSRKHINYEVNEQKFWDFSLDEYAIFDIPDTIDYILELTYQEKIIYIGFSQGASQGFASLSINPNLSKKFKIFIGLSPAMIPKNLNHPIANYVIHCSHILLYTFFGKKSLMPSVLFWQKMLSPVTFMRVVDKCLVLLFNWTHGNISIRQKEAGYPHMFSPTSVKTLVHWFQIIKRKRFQMFEENPSLLAEFITKDEEREYAYSNYPLETNSISKGCIFPVQTIRDLPMFLVYGTSDILIDMDRTMENLKNNNSLVDFISIDGYEHMDTLWASDVKETCFDPIIDRLKKLE